MLGRPASYTRQFLMDAPEVFIKCVMSSVCSVPESPPPLESDPVMWDISLTYGELTPTSVIDILQLAVKHCLLPSPHSFFDIGSGCGFPSILASAYFPSIESSGGVEIVPSLHNQSILNVAAAASLLEDEERRMRVSRITLVCGDCLSPENLLAIRSATLLFSNSTAFSEELMAGVVKAAEGLKPGAVFVCTSQKISSPLFELCEQRILPSSWGEATVRVYRRKRLGSWVKGFGRNLH